VKSAVRQSKAPAGISDYSDIPVVQESLGTFVSMYAGAGGMDIGFALAGFTPVWVNELDANAAATHELAMRRLRKERPHLAGSEAAMHVGDLLEVPQDQMPKRSSADLVIGGPPCQGFSVAGRMNPHDERSKHVFRFMDMVERVEPKAFVMENVKGLYENRRWAQIREELADRAFVLGYTAQMFLCNASHFGAPQARERMLFIGIRNGAPVAPAKTTEFNPPTLRDALAQLPALGEPGNDSLCRAKITPAKTPVMRKSPYAGMMFNGAGRPMDLDAPAPTVAASIGGNKTPIIDQEQLDHDVDPWIVDYHDRLANGAAPRKTVPSRMRRISVEEAAAIQTFPLGMEWCGPQSSQYRQIGNAVPPRLAVAAATATRNALGL
jgi:DNA (cytosine-5)-methyltransferase 1